MADRTTLTDNALLSRGSLRSRSAAMLGGLTLRQISAVLPPELAWGLWLSRQIVARIMDAFGPSLSGTRSTQLADRLMRWTGFPADRVARMCLDTHDRGGLYCMPQLNARIGWHVKRFAPAAYTRTVGLVARIQQ